MVRSRILCCNICPHTPSLHHHRAIRMPRTVPNPSHQRLPFWLSMSQSHIANLRKHTHAHTTALSSLRPTTTLLRNEVSAGTQQTLNQRLRHTLLDHTQWTSSLWEEHTGRLSVIGLTVSGLVLQDERFCSPLCKHSHADPANDRLLSHTPSRH
ncbi:hypothetical protein BC629DRAFT_334831 [Irpex lacteus]|nr:hypothetical protein BC629DRAFT_334831 [Irpex lacteus]